VIRRNAERFSTAAFLKHTYEILGSMSNRAAEPETIKSSIPSIQQGVLVE